MIRDAYINYLKQPIYYNGKCRPKYYGYDTFKNFKEFDRTESRLKDNEEVYFISDHHFNHKRIIQFSNRPFHTLAHMENMLVEQHNDMVTEDDIVIFVGDFGFCNNTEGRRILSRMNGYKIMVLGNHDVYHGKFKNFGYNEVYSILEWKYDDTQIIISHYPLKGFEDQYLNIHGHEHIGYTDETLSNHFNVNCEFLNYTPMNIKNIFETIKLRKENVNINGSK